jgi:hypothetical protein
MEKKILKIIFWKYFEILVRLQKFQEKSVFKGTLCYLELKKNVSTVVLLQELCTKCLKNTCSIDKCLELSGTHYDNEECSVQVTTCRISLFLHKFCLPQTPTNNIPIHLIKP